MKQRSKCSHLFNVHVVQIHLNCVFGFLQGSMVGIWGPCPVSLTCLVCELWRLWSIGVGWVLQFYFPASSKDLVPIFHSTIQESLTWSKLVQTLNRQKIKLTRKITADSKRHHLAMMMTMIMMLMDDEWWVMDDEWWMMTDEWWVMDDTWWMIIMMMMMMDDGWWMIDGLWMMDDTWYMMMMMMTTTTMMSLALTSWEFLTQIDSDWQIFDSTFS